MRSEKGFSLIEVIISILIVAILAVGLMHSDIGPGHSRDEIDCQSGFARNFNPDYAIKLYFDRKWSAQGYAQVIFEYLIFAWKNDNKNYAYYNGFSK
jgi:prepilin-type N-terminal cleavage/methylation domain-containing protein